MERSTVYHASFLYYDDACSFSFREDDFEKSSGLRFGECHCQQESMAIMDRESEPPTRGRIGLRSLAKIPSTCASVPVGP